MLMSTTKVTKRELFEGLLCLFEGECVHLSEGNDFPKEMYVDFIKHELKLLEKKGNRKTPTKNQKENEQLKNTIYEYLQSIERATATEIFVNCMADYSVQRTTSILYSLMEAGLVKKTTEKRKNYFSVV